MGTLALLWRDNKLLLSGFVLALVLAGFFAVRAVGF